MVIRSRTSRYAHVLERIGLAMAGASCGLFVAVDVTRTRIEMLASLSAMFAVTVCGAVGFYLGIDIPPHAALAGKNDPAELLSATGTFLAALAALVSVCIIVVDVELRIGSTVGVASCWLLGVTMQIVAGAIARIRRE
jgi:hypothetical protein